MREKIVNFSLQIFQRGKKGASWEKISSEKRWKERRGEPVSIFLITSVLLLPQKPFLVSKWQNLW